MVSKYHYTLQFFLDHSKYQAKYKLVVAGEMQGNYDRTAIAAAILDALLDALPLFAEKGFAGFSALYARFDGVLGRKVRVISGDNELIGMACGVTDEGALKVDDGTQVRELFGGEVSLRLQ